MDIMLTISAITSALDIVKKVRDIDKNIDAAEYRSRIAEILDALTEAKLALIEAKSVIADKDEEIRTLKSTAQQTSSLVLHKGYYYKKNADGAPTGKPHCPVCLQKHKMIFQLEKDTNFPGHPWICPSCNNQIGFNLSSFSE